MTPTTSAWVMCSVGSDCANSTTNAGEERSKCRYCRLGTGQEAYSLAYWRPKPRAKIRKHPVLARETALAKKQERDGRLRDKRRTLARRKLQRHAARAEADTLVRIRKTVNSGRSHRDGDHVVNDGIRLDTKLQSSVLHPVVDMAELSKIRRQAGDFDCIGALVLVNKNDDRVVAMALEDFVRIIGGKGENVAEVESQVTVGPR